MIGGGGHLPRCPCVFDRAKDYRDKIEFLSVLEPLGEAEIR